MQDMKRETLQSEAPRVLVYIMALACGLFLALVVHIALTAEDAGLSTVFQELFPASTDQLTSALAWWAIGLAGCLGSWATILLLKKPAAEPTHRLFRLGLAVVFFCLLALAGHEANASPAGSAAMSTAANLAAMTLGGFMAFFAAHFAARR